MKHFGINLTNVENLQKLLYRNYIISKETKDLTEVPDVFFAEIENPILKFILKEYNVEGLTPPNFKT